MRGAKSGRLVLPTKRTVNLAGAGKKKTNPAIALPAVIVIIIAAVLFSKFAVIDRLVKVSEAERAVAEVQLKIDQGYDKINSYGELVDKYAHYTFSDMTYEELNRIERIKVLNLIREVILPDAYIEGFTLTGNKLTVSVTDDTLQDINIIAQNLMAKDIVSFCTVTTAATNDRDLIKNYAIEDAGLVTAQLNVFLVGELEGGEE